MSHFSVRPLMAAMSLALTGVAHAAPGEASIWSFSGFGTLGAARSDQREADFVNNSFSQPSGAGRTKSTSFDPDTKLGVQLSAKITPDLSAVVQLVSQQNYQNSYRPAVEWANIKYQFTTALSARIGRIALPSFLVSETRYVSFANPWVRPPLELYGTNPLTSNDGIDARYTSTIGDAVNDFQAYYGTSTIKFSGGSTEAKGSPIWGFKDSLAIGATTMLVGYTSIKVDLTSPSLQPLVKGISSYAAAAGAFGFATASTQAYAMADQYRLTGIPLQLFSMGLSYDPGQWFAMGEFTHIKGASFFSGANAGYVSAGYRIGNWTPYFTLGKVKAILPDPSVIDTTGMPAPLAGPANFLTGTVNNALKTNATSQKTASLGVRWDFMKNFAAKLQYDHTQLGDNSWGHLTNRSPAFVPGGSFSVVSASVDFVF